MCIGIVIFFVTNIKFKYFLYCISCKKLYIFGSYLRVLYIFFVNIFYGYKIVKLFYGYKVVNNNNMRQYFCTIDADKILIVKIISV